MIDYIGDICYSDDVNMEDVVKKVSFLLMIFFVCCETSYTMITPYPWNKEQLSTLSKWEAKSRLTQISTKLASMKEMKWVDEDVLTLAKLCTSAVDFIETEGSCLSLSLEDSLLFSTLTKHIYATVCGYSSFLKAENNRQKLEGLQDETIKYLKENHFID